MKQEVFVIYFSPQSGIEIGLKETTTYWETINNNNIV